MEGEGGSVPSPPPHPSFFRVLEIMECNEEKSTTGKAPDPVVVSVTCGPEQHPILSSEGAQQQMKELLADLLWIHPDEIEVFVEMEF